MLWSNLSRFGTVVAGQSGGAQRRRAVGVLLLLKSKPASASSSRGGSRCISQTCRGVVKWYNAENGYGFIVPEDGQKDVFLNVAELRKRNNNHQSQIIAPFRKGEIVEFEANQNDSKGLRVTRVTGRQDPPAWSRRVRSGRPNGATTSLSSEDESQILKLLRERDECNSKDDAERIRKRLAADYGVGTEDVNRVWFVAAEEYVFADDRRRRLRRCRSLPAETERLIQEKVDRRAAAKLREDYDEGDALRAELAREYDVMIHDDTKTWSIRARGGAGAADADADTPWSRVVGSEAAAAGGGGAATNLLDPKDEERILSLLRARDGHRQKGEYEIADGIQDELVTKFNVRMYDRDKVWWVAGRTTTDDAFTRYTMVSPPGSGRHDDVLENNPELRSHIQGRVEKQALARLRKEFAAADAIRDQLRKEHGVRIDTRARTWHIVIEEPAAAPGNNEESSTENAVDTTCDAGTATPGTSSTWRRRRVVPGGPDDDDSSSLISPEDEAYVMTLLQQRDDCRSDRDYQEAESIRKELKTEFRVRIDDTNKVWWVQQQQVQVQQQQVPGPAEAEAVAVASTEEEEEEQSPPAAFARPVVNPEAQAYIQELISQRSLDKLFADDNRVATDDDIQFALTERYKALMVKYNAYMDEHHHARTMTGGQHHIHRSANDHSETGNGGSNDGYWH